jgi:hypothetical protein
MASNNKKYAVTHVVSIAVLSMWFQVSSFLRLARLSQTKLWSVSPLRSRNPFLWWDARRKQQHPLVPCTSPAMSDVRAIWPSLKPGPTFIDLDNEDPDNRDLYIMSAPKYPEWGFTVGRSKHPVIRAKQVANKLPVVLVVHCVFKACGYLEPVVHAKLQQWLNRDSNGREFFRQSLPYIVQCVAESMEEAGVPGAQPPIRDFSSLSRMCYYDILDIGASASMTSINKAFDRCAEIYHPAKGGDKRCFAIIMEARETLANPKRRRLYDLHGERDHGVVIREQDQQQSEEEEEEEEEPEQEEDWAETAGRFVRDRVRATDCVADAATAVEVRKAFLEVELARLTIEYLNQKVATGGDPDGARAFRAQVDILWCCKRAHHGVVAAR